MRKEVVVVVAVDKASNQEVRVLNLKPVFQEFRYDHYTDRQKPGATGRG